MPKVSFILPAYKRRFLHEAIASILAQTYRDFELVVVDDCSPEDLKSVVDEFHDERLTYQRNVKNLGGKDLVAAWNHALSYARGEWVVCAGDDDVYEPEYTEVMLSLAARYPEVDSLHCRLAFIDCEGKIMGLGKPRAEFEELIEVVYHGSVDRLDQRIPEFMYRRLALVKNGGYASSPKAWYSDIMTSIVMAQRHGSAFADSFLLRWRQSGENISSRCDDVPAKIEATVQFQSWMWQLIGTLSPKNNTEELILARIKDRVDQVALDSLWYYWCRVPCSAALKMLDHSSLDSAVKAKWRSIRIRAEYGPGGLYRKVRKFLTRN